MVNPRSASTVPLAVSRKLSDHITHLSPCSTPASNTSLNIALLQSQSIWPSCGPDTAAKKRFLRLAVDYGACAACGEVRNCATGRRGGGGSKHRPGLCRTSLSHKPRQARPQRSLMRNILWLPHKKNECAHSLFPSLSLILFLSTTHTYTYTTFTQYKCGVSDKKGSSLSTPPTPRTHTKWKQDLHEGKGYTYVLINA